MTLDLGEAYALRLGVRLPWHPCLPPQSAKLCPCWAPWKILGWMDPFLIQRGWDPGPGKSPASYLGVEIFSSPICRCHGCLLVFWRWQFIVSLLGIWDLLLSLGPWGNPFSHALLKWNTWCVHLSLVMRSPGTWGSIVSANVTSSDISYVSTGTQENGEILTGRILTDNLNYKRTLFFSGEKTA